MSWLLKLFLISMFFSIGCLVAFRWAFLIVLLLIIAFLGWLVFLNSDLEEAEQVDKKKVE